MLSLLKRYRSTLKWSFALSFLSFLRMARCAIAEVKERGLFALHVILNSSLVSFSLHWHA